MNPDKWAQWLLSRRDGGDPGIRSHHAPQLLGYRDSVLAGARIGPDDVLLDVGTGDGLIAFGALEQGARTVIFSDVSPALLQVCREKAADRLDRCRFVQAAADDLAGIDDSSVDVVTTRSVLIYVEHKPEAFTEFFRVLRPGGRLSIFEPINSFAALHGGLTLAGLDMTPVADLMEKMSAPYADDPAMVGFDERLLLLSAKAAGFAAIEMDYRVEWDVPIPAPDWSVLKNTAPNPLAPTYAEAMAATLTGAEVAELEGHIERLIATGAPARRTLASVFLRAQRAV